MWTAASKGTGSYHSGYLAVVIGGVCLHAAAALATGPGGVISPLDVVRSPPPTGASRHQRQWGWDSTGAIPVSRSVHYDGEGGDRHLGACTRIARCVTVRRTRLVGGWPRTVRLPAGGLVIPAGATMTLEPGGSHLALFGLRADLVQGETFPLTFDFDRTGEVNIIARVRRKGDAAGSTPLPPISMVDFSVAHLAVQLALQATPVATPHRR